MLLILVLLAWNTDAGMYRELYRVPQKGIDFWYVCLYFFNFFLFIIGYKLSKCKSYTYQNPLEFYSFYKILYYVTVGATLIWFANFIRMHGLYALFMFANADEMSQNMYLFREESGTISGITTMTEFSPIVATLAALIYRNTRQRMILMEMAFLVVLTIIRGAIFSQRIAFIEVLVPFGIAFVYDFKIRRIYNWIPILGVFALILVFGIFEYSRSWSTYYVDHYHGTFWEFIVDRVAGYYTVAINTECLNLAHSNPTYLPYFSMNGFFNLPILNQFEGAQDANIAYYDVLSSYGNPEFNNPGGMLIWLVDYGVFGLLFSPVFGYVVGRAYKEFVYGHLYGLIVYPVFVYGLLELPRLFFFGGKRGVFVAFAIFLVTRKLKK